MLLERDFYALNKKIMPPATIGFLILFSTLWWLFVASHWDSFLLFSIFYRWLLKNIQEQTCQIWKRQSKFLLHCFFLVRENFCYCNINLSVISMLMHQSYFKEEMELMEDNYEVRIIKLNCRQLFIETFFVIWNLLTCRCFWVDKWMKERIPVMFAEQQKFCLIVLITSDNMWFHGSQLFLFAHSFQISCSSRHVYGAFHLHFE